MLMLPDFRVRQRDFLLEISRAITAQLELHEVLRRILHASVVMLAGQVGLIALREQDDQFYVRAYSGIPAELIPNLNQHLHELAEIVKDKPDAEAFNEKLREMSREINPELRQSVALPMTFADEPLGLMIVFRSYLGEASANDMKVLASFADQAAIAVHNAQLYEQINQESQRLAAILQHSADGVMILNADLKIERFNHALERMTGWDAVDAIGLYNDDVIIWEKLEQGDLRGALDNGWPFTYSEKPAESSLYVEGDLQQQDGMSISVAITYAPLLTADGRLTNIIANVRDITNFRRAQEMQNTFVSVISHELKTPVAIIKGYAATLRRQDVTWDQDIVQDNLGVIEEEADRLDALIQNLLSASKLQAQRGMSLDIGDVWLDSIAHRAVERFATQTDKHEIIVNFPGDFPVIQGDEARLRQVIDNLIGNAIKYSPDGGIIEVSGYFDAKTVTFEIHDHGVGLTKEDKELVFDRFFRVDGKLSRKTQGAGLGLYLSKAIIEAHNGTISVDSQPKKGSTFYFTLPRL